MKRNRSIVNSVLLTALILCFVLACSGTVFAATAESEPNDSISTAQKISFGKEYTGTVVNVEDEYADDEDYYRIPVKEGKFYKITIFNMKDLDEDGWGTMIVSLCKDSDTDYGTTIRNGEYKKTSKLFNAAYSGYYYLKFWNSTNTQYSFKIEKFNPRGKKVKDSDSNIYKITGDSTLEFSKMVSKKKTSFYLDTEPYFSKIGTFEVLDYYDVQFTVTAIGNYAFKGCSIKSIDLPKEIKTIGVGAFENCKRLGSETYMMGLVIGGKNVTIKSKAFKGCKKLGSIRILKSASVKSVKKGAFKGTKKGIHIEVPSVKKYKKIFKNAGFKKPVFEKTLF